jgi:hypothetical protein
VGGGHDKIELLSDASGRLSTLICRGMEIAASSDGLVKFNELTGVCHVI